MPDEEKHHSKPTALEHQQRIDECVELLRLRFVDGKSVTVGTIKKLFATKYKSRPRTVLRYIKKAQERIIAQSGLSKSTHKALTTEFLNSIIGNPDIRTSDRLAANKQYMELFGLAVGPKVVPADGGLQQHLHLHSSTPLTLEQRKQALLEHLGIRAADPECDHRGGSGETRAIDVIEVSRRHPG